MILLVYKEIYFNTNKFDHCIPSVCVSLLQDYMNIFSNEVPSRHAKWVEFIKTFLYIIKYNQGKKHIVANTLL
jgi:hypothetical protein